MTWWGWWRRNRVAKKAQAEQAEAQLRQVQRATPQIERIAGRMSIPDEEFADRVADAFRLRRRPT